MKSIFLGTQGWSFSSWVGSFYPSNTAVGDFLREYAGKFKAVEIDSTYYGTPRPETVRQWYAVTPTDFRFTAKFPQAIVRDSLLAGAERETARFLATMGLLGDKLGPLLLQYPYPFAPERREALTHFLAELPTDFRYAVQVRQNGWLNDDFYGILQEHRVALAVVDRAAIPDAEPVTTDFTYVRWVGSRKDVPVGDYSHAKIDRDRELERWGAILGRFADDGVAIWGFVNNHYQGHSPATVRALMERLNIPQPVPVRFDSSKDSPAPPAQERRGAPRVDATYKIAYECFNSWGVKVDEGPARTVDISGRGALIEIQRGVPLDASMVLLVMAPFHMLMVKGSVVHSRRAPNGTFHVGVHLTEVVEGTWDVLDWVIRERISEKAEWPS